MKIELVSEVSIDGKITFGMGKSSKDLFNLMTEDDLKYIHSIRSKVDGILVGMNTIRNDNSSLTCRYVKGKNPIRLIPSNSLELRDDFNILNVRKEKFRRIKDLIFSKFPSIFYGKMQNIPKNIIILIF